MTSTKHPRPLNTERCTYIVADVDAAQALIEQVVDATVVLEGVGHTRTGQELSASTAEMRHVATISVPADLDMVTVQLSGLADANQAAIDRMEGRHERAAHHQAMSERMQAWCRDHEEQDLRPGRASRGKSAPQH